MRGVQAPHAQISAATTAIHSHVAFALNRLRFKGCAQWNLVILAAWMFLAGSFVSLSRAAYSLLPSLLLYGLILLLGGAGSGSRDG
jgi:hypothetical protein